MRLAALLASLILAFTPQEVLKRGTPISTGAGGTWSSTQLKFRDSAGNGTGGGTCTAGGTTCAVTVASVGANHLLVAFMLYVSTSGSALTVSVASAGETWTHCSSCAFLATGGSGNGTDAAYVLTAAGGETTVTCTISSATNSYLSCGVFEYAWSGSTRTFDVSNGGLDATCTSCTGQVLTLTGTSDVVMQFAVPEQTISAITGGAGYTNPQQFYGGNGIAGAINTTNGAAPTWTQAPTGRVTVMAMSFKGT